MNTTEIKLKLNKLIILVILKNSHKCSSLI